MDLFDMDDKVIEKYKTYCKLIVNWFLVCIRHSKQQCYENIQLHMYLAPLDKTLPEHNRNALSEENANSAYTYYCKKKNKIVVFREEEWFKVLLHETFHYLKMEYFHPIFPSRFYLKME